MSKNAAVRIELHHEHDMQVNAGTHKGVSALGRGTELEKRITPLLVVICIIAVLIGLYLPAVQY